MIGEDAEIQAYYADRTEDERTEERAWGEVGYEALAATARTEERRAVRNARKRRPPRKRVR